MQSKIKICHISTAHQANDDRIFLKQCLSLSKAGFEVYFVVQCLESTCVQGVNIVSLKKRENRFSRILFAPLEAFRKGIKTKAELFHLHDPELLPLCMLFYLYGKKVIFDSHEDIPRQLFSKAWLGPRWFRTIVSLVYRWYEKFCLLWCVKVISVTPEIVSRFPKTKQVLVRNYPIVALARQREHTSTLPLRLVYAGGLTKIRGIKEIILAIEPFAGEVQLVLLGKWASKEYEQECKTLHGWQYVQYEGQVDPQDVYSYYITCDIGMALLYPEPNYLHSLPVKAFEYLACGLPIIMSDFPYWQTHFSAGAIFVNPMQPADISASISELKNNLHQRITLGRQGKAMVLAQFSWEAESQTLIKTYTQLLGENRKN